MPPLHPVVVAPEVPLPQPASVEEERPGARPPERARRLRRRTWRRQFLDDGPVVVSVCIANWNCRAMLRACLESLHDQPQGARVETVVVDNASADGAADMVEAEFPEVILVRSRRV